MSRYNDIMETVFKWEGGFVDNPFDNGGPTNWGITHKVLAQWRGVSGVTREEVKKLTKEEAADIFSAKYWKRIRGNSFHAPVDLIMMDGAVNHGVPAMSRMLQKTLGIDETGRIGKETIAAVEAYATTSEAIDTLAIKLADARKMRYITHEDAQHFLAGWRNRLNDVMAVAMNGRNSGWTFKDGKNTESQSNIRSEAQPASSFPLPIIEDVDLQAMLMTVGLYTGDLDGLFGQYSSAALEQYLTHKSSAISGNWPSWPLERKKIALGQFLCYDLEINPGRIDGLVGPQTMTAFEEFNRRKLGLPQNDWRDEIDKLPATGLVPTLATWPTESDVPAFFGDLGKDCTLVPLRRLSIPYKMKLAWDLGTKIDGFRVHEKVYDSAARVFDNFYAHYGDDGVEDLGLDLFGGSTSCRVKKGGKNWSMHAWSIAIDFDPARNQLKWSHKQSRLAKPDAVRFWQFWEAEGWVSLGRAKDFDWMHVQAARV